MEFTVKTRELFPMMFFFTKVLFQCVAQLSSYHTINLKYPRVKYDKNINKFTLAMHI